VETIKRQTRVAYSWLVEGQSVAYRLYARSVCDMNSAAAAAVCGLWRYTSVICLCLCPLPVLLKPVTYSGMTNGDGFLQQEMSVKNGEYSATVRLGRNLKDRCTKSDPERDILTSMLDQLKNKWNSLRSIATQRYMTGMHNECE